MEKELTSSIPPSFQEGSNFSIFQRSILGSSSHGLGLSCFPLCFLPLAVEGPSPPTPSRSMEASSAMNTRSWWPSVRRIEAGGYSKGRGVETITRVGERRSDALYRKTMGQLRMLL